MTLPNVLAQSLQLRRKPAPQAVAPVQEAPPRGLKSVAVRRDDARRTQAQENTWRDPCRLAALVLILTNLPCGDHRGDVDLEQHALDGEPVDD